MAYSDFKLSNLIKIFGLTLQESSELFAQVAEVECSELLNTILTENVDVAVSINTEKARSEMIISPILLEVRRKLNFQVSLFSGIDFNVDFARGLNGFCDFLMSQSKEQLFIRSPVVVIVEAKNENLKAGLGQCVAAMLGSQIFNEQEGNDIQTIYGAVTIGTVWQFLKLEKNIVSIDLREYYIRDIQKILGILVAAMNHQPRLSELSQF